MGVFDQLAEMLKPHADRASSEFAFHMAALHTRLSAIERATNDLGRGDIGNKWQRFQIRRKFLAGENFEVGTCPINEIWLIEAICSDGVEEKSPAVVLLANGIVIASFAKEVIVNEKYGSNQAVLPGEILSITARTEASVNLTITIIRRLYPVGKVMADMGKGTEVHSPKQMHDPMRDEIAQRIPALYGPQQDANAPTEGRSEQLIQMTERQ